MGKLVNITPEQEKAYRKKAKQYQRVKITIIILAILFAIISGIIVVSNGLIFKLFGISNYGEGLSIFFVIMYLLIVAGIVLIFLMMGFVVYKVISEYIKDKFLRK